MLSQQLEKFTTHLPPDEFLSTISQELVMYLCENYLSPTLTTPFVNSFSGFLLSQIAPISVRLSVASTFFKKAVFSMLPRTSSSSPSVGSPLERLALSLTSLIEESSTIPHTLSALHSAALFLNSVPSAFQIPSLLEMVFSQLAGLEQLSNSTSQTQHTVSQLQLLQLREIASLLPKKNVLLSSLKGYSFMQPFPPPSPPPPPYPPSLTSLSSLPSLSYINSALLPSSPTAELHIFYTGLASLASSTETLLSGSLESTGEICLEKLYEAAATFEALDSLLLHAEPKSGAEFQIRFVTLVSEVFCGVELLGIVSGETPGNPPSPLRSAFRCARLSAALGFPLRSADGLSFARSRPAPLINTTNSTQLNPQLRYELLYLTCATRGILVDAGLSGGGNNNSNVGKRDKLYETNLPKKWEILKGERAKPASLVTESAKHLIHSCTRVSLKMRLASLGADKIVELGESCFDPRMRGAVKILEVDAQACGLLSRLCKAVLAKGGDAADANINSESDFDFILREFGGKVSLTLTSISLREPPLN